MTGENRSRPPWKRVDRPLLEGGYGASTAEVCSFEPCLMVTELFGQRHTETADYLWALAWGGRRASLTGFMQFRCTCR